MISDGTLEPAECDQVFEAEYCIKATGRAFGGKRVACLTNLTIGKFYFFWTLKDFSFFFSGGIGTKRFCSSLDLGNYCNYVQQPGDQLEYRSCLFTCTGDGCNSATLASISRSTIFFLPVLTVLRRLFFWFLFSKGKGIVPFRTSNSSLQCGGRKKLNEQSFYFKSWKVIALLNEKYVK